VKKYRAVLKLKSDEHPVYFITVEAKNDDEAIYNAKKFLAENGYWSSLTHIEKRMEQIEFLYFDR